jgi:hypothetical protein
MSSAHAFWSSAKRFTVSGVTPIDFVVDDDIFVRASLEGLEGLDDPFWREAVLPGVSLLLCGL